MTESKLSTQKDWEDPDDAPDLSSPYWQKIIDATPVMRGRPAILDKKVSTTIRLDADILRQFRAQGPRWQSRINDVLKEYLARG